MRDSSLRRGIIDWLVIILDRLVVNLYLPFNYYLLLYIYYYTMKRITQFKFWVFNPSRLRCSYVSVMHA